MFNDLPIWAYILITLVYTHITIAAVTIYLHRHQAHRALDLHPMVGGFFRVWLWLTTGMGTREWVAVHRKHHANVETEEDPHSPQVRGIRKVLFQGTELYRQASRDLDALARYGHQTPDDWLERRVFHRFPNTGVGLMLVANLALFGAIGLTIWAVQMMWIPFFAAGVINGIGHWWGYRNYESPDASTNIVPFGVLIGGEELHNNHHAFASSARFSSKWYELDLGWWYIRTLQFLRLAKVKKLPPMLVVDQGKQGVDRDTVHAVIASRLQVMSQYAREVVGEVVDDEKRRANVAARRLLRRAKRLMTRHETLRDSAAQRRLEELLARHYALRVVYEFHQRLQELWLHRTASQDGLVHSLQEWCRQAEATGIHSLQAFARKLRGFTLQTA